MTYNLKIAKQYFDAIVDGDKTWILRKNDRNFRYGDTLVIQEIDFDGNYTGRTCTVRVKYVYASIHGINHGLCGGYCIMSIEKEVIDEESTT